MGSKSSKQKESQQKNKKDSVLAENADVPKSLKLEDNSKF